VAQIKELGHIGFVKTADNYKMASNLVIAFFHLTRAFWTLAFD